MSNIRAYFGVQGLAAFLAKSEPVKGSSHRIIGRLKCYPWRAEEGTYIEIDNRASWPDELPEEWFESFSIVDWLPHGFTRRIGEYPRIGTAKGNVTLSPNQGSPQIPMFYSIISVQASRKNDMLRLHQAIKYGKIWPRQELPMDHPTMARSLGTLWSEALDIISISITSRFSHRSAAKTKPGSKKERPAKSQKHDPLHCCTVCGHECRRSALAWNTVIRCCPQPGCMGRVINAEKPQGS